MSPYLLSAGAGFVGSRKVVKSMLRDQGRELQP